MKIRTKRIIITICVSLIIIAAVLMAFNRLKTPEISPDDITDFRVEYRVYGGMEGENTELTLRALSDTEALLTVHEAPYNSDEVTDESIRVPIEALDRIKAIYIERGVPFWGELPDEEFFALDAPTVSVSFFADGEETVITSDEQFPKSGKGILSEIKSVLYEYRE